MVLDLILGPTVTKFMSKKVPGIVEQLLIPINQHFPLINCNKIAQYKLSLRPTSH